MPIAKEGSGGDFAVIPVQLAPAIACDVIDLGEQETPFKIEKGPRAGETKFAHQIKIVWQVHPEDEEGNPMRRDDGKVHLLSKYYTLSLAEKANLRKDLDSWRGVPFTEEELQDGWEVEQVIGAQCNLQIIPNKKDPAKRRSVGSVLPRNRRDPKLELEEYVREMDRPGGQDIRSPAAEAGGGKSATKPAQQQEEEDDDFELPF